MKAVKKLRRMANGRKVKVIAVLGGDSSFTRTRGNSKPTWHHDVMLVLVVFFKSRHQASL